jgi:hypothetical protein
MKKLFLLIITAAVLFGLQGCENYLARTPESEGLDEEAVFTDYLNFREFNDGLYDGMHDYLSTFDQSSFMAITDEGYTDSDWETLAPIQAGQWLGAVGGSAAQSFSIWGGGSGIQSGWSKIRRANISLKNIPKLQETNASTDQIDQIKGQAHFMRAWWYFEIMRRHGGMPYITKVLEPTDNFALERDTFYETAKNIAADCDTAAALLPERWNSNHVGRATQGAAMALKATALLYAASPNNNPDNDMSRWEEAAEASWAFISFAESSGRYRLLDSTTPTTLEYMTPNGAETITYNTGRDSVFMYNTTNDEIIWENYQSLNASPYQTFGVPSLVSRSFMTGYSPSQSIVDKFETINGLAIEDDPDYDPEDPYVDRDPRFYQTILFNRRQWAGNRYLELWEGGRERTGEKYFSYTGYLSNKYWPSYVHNESGANPPQTHTIYLRYADLLLQYAEAANEIGGPDHAVSGANMTAVEAVNRVRDRVGMPGVDSQYLTDKSTFRERIKNERAVELYYEQKRFFDLQRWGDSHKQEHKQIYGVDITEASGSPTGYDYTRTSAPIHTNTFEQKHYRIPIPPGDVNLFDKFEQNPGW